MMANSKNVKYFLIRKIWVAVLSIFAPGLGHVYNGSTKRGITIITINAILIFGLLEIEHASAPSLLMLYCLFLTAFVCATILFVAAFDAVRRTQGENGSSNGKWFRSTWVVGTLYFVLIVVLRGELPARWRTFYIPSDSNAPTILVGDRIITVYYAQRNGISRGDMVVFRPPGEPGIFFVKRVIGLPGDTVQMTNGQLYINGMLISRVPVGTFTDTGAGVSVTLQEFSEILPNGRAHMIIKATNAGFANNTPIYTVPPGDLFMIGDNRDDSEDSPFLEGPVGYVPTNNVIGRVTLVYWPLGRIHQKL